MRKLPLLLLVGVLCLTQQGTRSGIDRGMFDATCKPCDDFWRNATGTWVDKHPIPADAGRLGTFDELSEANLERLKTILDSAAADSQAAGDRRKVGDYYASCVDTGAIEAAGKKPIQPLLRQVAAIRSRQDLVALLGNLELQDAIAATG